MTPPSPIEVKKLMEKRVLRTRLSLGKILSKYSARNLMKENQIVLLQDSARQTKLQFLANLTSFD